MLNVVLNWFIPAAWADTAVPATQTGGGMSMLVMLIVFIAFMYFAMWRPQMRRNKEQQNLLNSLAPEDEVCTLGGMLGTIVKVTDNYVTLALADNVHILVQKTAITNTLPKGTIKSLAT